MDRRRPSPSWFAVFVLLSFFPFPVFLPSDSPLPSSETAFAKEVIDGDTIILRNGEHIRYIGIDAPEVRRKVGDRWIYAPEPFAEEAKRYNERLVTGRRLALVFDRERKDRYGRTLAYVYADDLFVNAKMVEEGYARVLVLRPNTRYFRLLQRLEREAMNARRGIWSVRRPE